MWYGEYTHTLDDKDRFILPSKFRDKVKEFDVKKLYITRGLDRCLFLFSKDTWIALEEKLKALSFAKQEARFFNRLYFSGAHEIEIDSQGRIAIPKHLKDFSSIIREIVIIGVADRIEIWDKGLWRSFYQDNQKKFEDMADKLFE